MISAKPDLDRHLVGEDEKNAADALKAKLESTSDATILPPEKSGKDGKIKGAPTSGLPGKDGKTAVSDGTSVAALDGKTEEKQADYKPLNGGDGKPIDFVLQQAMNQLKGLPVAANPRALVATASNAVTTLKPKLDKVDVTEKAEKGAR